MSHNHATYYLKTIPKTETYDLWYLHDLGVPLRLPFSGKDKRELYQWAIGDFQCLVFIRFTG